MKFRNAKLKFKEINQKFTDKANQLTAASVLALASVAQTASAAAPAADDPFIDFYTAVDSYANGGLGVGLAIVAMLLGGGIGIVRSTAIPALTGVFLAAIFAWGPDVILSIMTDGAIV